MLQEVYNFNVFIFYLCYNYINYSQKFYYSKIIFIFKGSNKRIIYNLKKKKKNLFKIIGCILKILNFYIVKKKQKKQIGSIFIINNVIIFYY